MDIPGYHEAQERYDHALPPEGDDTAAICDACGKQLDPDDTWTVEDSEENPLHLCRRCYDWTVVNAIAQRAAGFKGGTNGKVT